MNNKHKRTLFHIKNQSKYPRSIIDQHLCATSHTIKDLFKITNKQSSLFLQITHKKNISDKCEETEIQQKKRQRQRCLIRRKQIIRTQNSFALHKKKDRKK